MAAWTRWWHASWWTLREWRASERERERLTNTANQVSLCCYADCKGCTWNIYEQHDMLKNTSHQWEPTEIKLELELITSPPTWKTKTCHQHPLLMKMLPKMCKTCSVPQMMRTLRPKKVQEQVSGGSTKNKDDNILYVQQDALTIIQTNECIQAVADLEDIQCQWEICELVDAACPLMVNVEFGGTNISLLATDRPIETLNAHTKIVWGEGRGRDPVTPPNESDAKSCAQLKPGPGKRITKRLLACCSEQDNRLKHSPKQTQRSVFKQRSHVLPWPRGPNANDETP